MVLIATRVRARRWWWVAQLYLRESARVAPKIFYQRDASDP
jgi:hypothetical protein